MSDNGQPKQSPPGRCDACGKDISEDRFFELGGQPGKKFHRDHVGQPCGPVLTRFLYRVVAWVQPPAGFGYMETFPIERTRPLSTYGEYAALGEFIAAGAQASSPDGTLIVGVKPRVSVIVAELLATQ